MIFYYCVLPESAGKFGLFWQRKLIYTFWAAEILLKWASLEIHLKFFSVTKRFLHLEIIRCLFSDYGGHSGLKMSNNPRNMFKSTWKVFKNYHNMPSHSSVRMYELNFRWFFNISERIKDSTEKFGFLKKFLSKPIVQSLAKQKEIEFKPDPKFFWRFLQYSQLS